MNPLLICVHRLAAGMVLGAALLPAQAAPTAPAPAAAITPTPATTLTSKAATACPAVLRHSMLRLQDERPVDLCSHAGKVVLVVNTASRCGYTGQYAGLEALNKTYGPRGFVVLGFPSNDFGSQEPGSNAAIAEFCENTFNVRFPMFTKTSVRGTGGTAVNPLFAQLAERTGQRPGWNFHKYLIGRDGQVVISHPSAVEPESRGLTRDIERLLQSK